MIAEDRLTKKRKMISVFNNFYETFSIHHKNIQFLALELYKMKDGLLAELIYDIFTNRS